LGLCTNEKKGNSQALKKVFKFGSLYIRKIIGEEEHPEVRGSEPTVCQNVNTGLKIMRAQLEN